MTTKQANLLKAVEHALKDCPALLSEIIISTEAISVDITACYDDEGRTVDLDCLENCKSGSFTASVKMEAPLESGKIIPSETVSGTFEVTDYDSKTYSFTAKIERVYLSS